MKNRSLKAGGRLNRWSLKAGFTVNDKQKSDDRTTEEHTSDDRSLTKKIPDELRDGRF